MSNKKSNNGLLVLAGFMAGAASAYFLTTPRGKKVIENVKAKTTEASNKVVEIAAEMAEKSKKNLEALETKLADTSIKVLDHAENKVDDFKNGINKAKKSMQNGMA